MVAECSRTFLPPLVRAGRVVCGATSRSDSDAVWRPVLKFSETVNC